MVHSISFLLCGLAAAESQEGSAAGEVLSLLQTQVHKHNATTVVGEPADVVDPPNVVFPGYNFHEFRQSLCEKFGERWELKSVGASAKCPTKIIPSNVDTFNKDLASYGGCAPGQPFTSSWKARVATGHRDGLGRGDGWTSGDGPATEAATEACRLAAEKDPRCAGANVYMVQKYFCTCYGGVVAIAPQDIGYYRYPSGYLTCALKSLPASLNPRDLTSSSDGAGDAIYSIKETSSLQGCSKGWYSLNGGGISYDSGQIDGSIYYRVENANKYRRPSDCAARIASIKAGFPGMNPADHAACKNSVGVRMHPAGATSPTQNPQKDCGCLYTSDLANARGEPYRPHGPGEFGGSTGSSLGSWICLLDDGDVTKGDSLLPAPKKSGKYKADGPSASKDNLSPEEKAKCKTDRSRLRAAKKALKEDRTKLKEARAAVKTSREYVAAIKKEMEKC